jgi:hypothetical protein
MVSFMPLLLYPQKLSPDIDWIGGWVGPIASLDAMEKRKISFPCQEPNPDSFPAQLVDYFYTD